MERPMFSDVAKSNLYTMTCAADHSPAQKLPSVRCIPDAASAMLRARLILEEALETINALGVRLHVNVPEGVPIKGMEDCFLITAPITDQPKIELAELIDGCCDLIYVAVGTMLVCGIPDLPHLDAVNRANIEKFPRGVATVNEHGKFQKPEGWRAPDHWAVMGATPHVNLYGIGQDIRTAVVNRVV